MNTLQVFNNKEFGQVRVINKHGDPWFVAKDVCECLDIRNYRDAVSRLDEDETGSVLVDTLGGQQTMNAVNEGGMYSLIFKSRKPEAKKFKRWVTHEVLPSIRQHGIYGTPATIQKMITNPEWGITLLTALKTEQEKHSELQAQVITDTPYTNFGKSIAASSDAITIGEFAKLAKNNGICIGRNRLFDWFRNNGYLIKGGSERNKPMQRFLEQGLFVVRESVIHTVQKDMTRTTTLMTGKGQLYFLEKLEAAFNVRC